MPTLALSRDRLDSPMRNKDHKAGLKKKKKAKPSYMLFVRRTLKILNIIKS